MTSPLLFLAMVSEDSPPSNSNSNILHQFSNSIADHHNQFGNQIFNAYGIDSVSNNSYPLNIPCLVHAPNESNIGHDTRLMDLLGTSNDHPPQRLSLSLGGCVPSSRQRPLNSSPVNNPGNYLFPCNMGADNVVTDYSFSGSGFASWTLKYLKPAQSLLQEMVSVGGKDVDDTNQKYAEKLSRRKGSHRLSSEIKSEISNTGLLSDQHSTYVNLLKLLSLLEEVERRYDEYYRHMEELVASFEMIAGLGSGKSYTALALQAMSKHFSSLRDAIVSQIRVTKQKIEKDTPKISSGLSQLSLLDQETRHTRISLHQLWPLHSSRQTWRPIRGLPETSVTILRAWLFEHFLHPYPSESEKLMLASQTGLSKNQVSNWFINARVRLWKPMIEEMYKEEFGESSTETSSSTRDGVGDSAEDLN